jgi:hypothetical protein
MLAETFKGSFSCSDKTTGRKNTTAGVQKGMQIPDVELEKWRRS